MVAQEVVVVDTRMATEAITPNKDLVRLLTNQLQPLQATVKIRMPNVSYLP